MKALKLLMRQLWRRAKLCRPLESRQRADIFYEGSELTRSCIKALERMVQFGDKLSDVALLTCEQDRTHAFALRRNDIETVIIKPGFASGYPGEGSKGLGTALRLFLDQDLEIVEYMVERSTMARMTRGDLTKADLDRLRLAPRNGACRIYDYIHDAGMNPYDAPTYWRAFPIVLPYCIMDYRLKDLMKRFDEDPNTCLGRAYIRLEDIIRARTGLKGLPSKALFEAAFLKTPPKLKWQGVDEGGGRGRAQLFIHTFQAYRNHRAHNEVTHALDECLRELALLNHLFHLERAAADVSANDSIEIE